MRYCSLNSKVCFPNFAFGLDDGVFRLLFFVFCRPQLFFGVAEFGVEVEDSL